MRVLTLLCFLAVVVCGRLCLVFYAGSPIPFHDQWYAEAQGILVPYLQHGLTLGHFFAPHGDHVIAPTRLLALLIVKAEGRWDCLTEMVVNCVLSAACLLPLMWWALLRDRRGMLAAGLCLAVGVSYGSPLFYGNVIWGFQSQILLMIGFSVCHLYLVTVEPGGWGRWSLGMVTGVLATVCFASGYLAVVVSTIAVLVGRGSPGLTPRYVAWSVAAGLGIIAFALWLAPAHAPVGAPMFANVVHTFVHALGFPNRLFSYWGILFWLPTVVAGALMLRRRELALGLGFPLAAALWCLLQALAISVGRSEPVIALAPRYYDILMVGVVANGCLGIGLLKAASAARGARIIATALMVSWVAVVGAKMAGFIGIQMRGDVPALVNQATQQLDLIARFYRESENLDVLRASAFPVRPLPDAELLGELLKRADLKSLWPKYIFEWRLNDELRDLPWLGGIPREAWFRGSLLIAVIGVVVLYVRILWSLFGRTWRTPAAGDDGPQ